jgi:hypothetical protein
MADENNLESQLPTEGHEQFSDPLLIDFVNEPKGFVKDENSSEIWNRISQSCDSQRKSGYVHNTPTSFIGGVFEQKTPPLEYQLRLRFTAFALEIDPEGIWVIENGPKAFRYDARYPGVSLFLNILGDLLDDGLCFGCVTNPSPSNPKPSLLFADLDPEMVPVDEDSVESLA